MPTKEPFVEPVKMAPAAPAPIPERIAVTKAQRPVIKSAPEQENGNQQITTDKGPEESAGTEESVNLSPQVSALARKEQAFREREARLKQREQDLEADLKSAQEYKELKTKLGQKDFSKAEELGLNYDEYVQYKLEKVTDEDPNVQAIKGLEKKLTDLEKKQEEEANQEFEATVSAYKTEIFKSVENDPQFATVKKFEMMGSEGKTFTGKDVALRLILDAWENDGEELSVEQALTETKTFISEFAKKMAGLIDEPKPVEDAKKLPPPKPGVKTLTNQMQSGAKKAFDAKPLHTLSDAERYQEARRRMLAKRNGA